MPIDLSGLNPAQREAVAHTDGPLLVVAGPGSGKTRVITHRIANLIDEHGVEPWAILAVTFTNKAAAEMRNRVNALTGRENIHVSTFHSFGATFLRREAARLGMRDSFTIYDQREGRSRVAAILDEHSIDAKAFPPAQILAAISAAKNAGKGVDTAEAEARGYREEVIAKVYRGYQESLKQSNALDFDDLLLEPVAALAKHEDLRAQYGRRYRYMLVDEYQDTNRVQYDLARLIAGGHQNLCVTGDPDQSIYSWRGADIRNILEFQKDFPNARVVMLGENYRSSGTIVATADALVRANRQRLERPLTTSNEQGPPVAVVLCHDQQHEADQIAGSIADLVKYEGVPEREIAVFYRTNAQSRAIEARLRAGGIPYVVIGSVEFYRRKEIADLLAWLRFLVNPYDESAFIRAVSSPKRGVGDSSIAKFLEAARRAGGSILDAVKSPMARQALPGKARGGLTGFASAVGELEAARAGPVEETIKLLLTVSKYEDWITETETPETAAERIENIKELVTDAAQWDEDNRGRGLEAYIEHISLINDVDKWDPSRQAVGLMTLHAAKGLEFDAVFIAGVEDGVLPHARVLKGDSDAGMPVKQNADFDELEEERRLFYVGITRARRHLTLTLARYREGFGTVSRNMPSRFLAELPREMLALSDHTGSGLLRAGVERGKGGVGGGATGRAGSTLAGASEDDGAARVPWDDDGEPVVRRAAKADAGSVPWDDDGEGSAAGPKADHGRRRMALASDDHDPWADADLSPGLLHLPGGKGGSSRAAHEDEPRELPRPSGSPGGFGGEGKGTLSVGDRVKHGMFGIGTVTGLSKGAGGVRARIFFDGWGEKNLALEYAKLEKVQARG
jgi:DNA helicase-2/ATP-dependent DNA helicase PcrA